MQAQRGTWIAFLARVACVMLFAGTSAAQIAAPTKDKPPTVTLTSPASGASFFAPAAINLAASASDPDGTVTRVDFFQGTTLIGSSNTSPSYTFTWTNVAIGSYTLTAKATDNSGSTATSAPVSITVNSATALVITSPTDGAAFNVSSGITVTGTFESSFTSGNTILVDNGDQSALATISGNSYSANFLGGTSGLGSNTFTVNLSRPDKSSARRTITLFGYDTPVVAFTAPSSSTFNAPATVTFAVDAKAPGGTVAKVDFLNGNTLVGTVTPPQPYQVTLSNLAAGTYTITANATSNQGPVGTATDTIVVQAPNIPPSISITSPAAGAVFNAPATVPIAVNATDSDGSVTLVEFFANGATIGATSVPPFSFTWANVAAGSYSLTARATDNRSGQTTSAPVSITVNNPPTATLTSPVQGASFSAPSTVTLTATASDTDGTVVRVEFYQGTTLIGPSTISPYAVSWSVIAPGTYTLTARAIDNQGGVGVSAPVTVTISGSITYLHNDFAGNPIAATDANGALIWKENFRPYGDRLNNQAAAAGNRQWFHGKPADVDTGLSYFGARYYDPTLGRFMGMDPERFSENNLHSFNCCAYGNNNPYRYIDPNGRGPQENFERMILHDSFFEPLAKAYAAVVAVAYGAITGNEALANVGMEELHANSSTNRELAVGFLGTTKGGGARRVRVRDLDPLHSSETVGERPDLRKLSDAELIKSVTDPANGDMIKINTKTGKVVDGNSRTLELQRRANDPRSSIKPDTEVPVTDHTPDNSMSR